MAGVKGVKGASDRTPAKVKRTVLVQRNPSKVAAAALALPEIFAMVLARLCRYNQGVPTGAKRSPAWV